MTNDNRKHFLLTIFDPRSSIVKIVIDCHLSVVVNISQLDIVTDLT